MDKATGIHEPTITIPWRLVCQDNEFRVMPIDSRHEKRCSNRYPDPDMPHKDCDCHEGEAL